MLIRVYPVLLFIAVSGAKLVNELIISDMLSIDASHGWHYYWPIRSKEASYFCTV